MPLAGRPLRASDIGGSWTGLVVQVNQGGNRTSTNDCYFTRVGLLVVARFDITITAAGAANNEIRVYAGSLPAPHIAAGYAACGIFRYFDTGTTVYVGSVNLNTDGTWYLNFNVGGDPPLGNQMGSTPSFAVANGDVLSATIEYRGATAS